MNIRNDTLKPEANSRISPRLASIVTTLVLILILGHFSVIGLSNVYQNNNSNRGDNSSTLRLGLKIKHRVALTDGSRHPLYPAILSLFAEKEFAYFTKSKLVTLGIKVLALVVIFILLRRTFNPDIAVLTVFLLSISGEFVDNSASLRCEALLTLFFFLSWYYMVKGFRDPNWKHWLRAGLFAGAAYLTKASGQFLLITFAISALILLRKKVLRDKRVWLFLAAYLALASILFAYNLRVYGNPLYNVNTAHVMWLEDWEEIWVANEESLPTMRTYLETHTLTEILTRQWHGIKSLKMLFVHALAPANAQGLYDFFQSEYSTAVILLAPLTAFALRKKLYAYYHANKERTILTVVLLVVSSLTVAWYAKVVPAARFLLPLAPFICLWLAELVKAGLRYAVTMLGSLGEVRLKAMLPAGYVLLYASLGWWLCSSSVGATENAFKDPFERDRLVNSVQDRVLSWLAEGTEPGAVIAYGPSHSLPVWKYWERLDFVRVPSNIGTWEELSAYLASNNAQYAIIDEEIIRRRPQLLGQYFESTGGKVVVHSQPPDWALTYAFPGVPCDFCTYQLLKTRPIKQPLQVVLGGQVKLLGYDAIHNSFMAGDTVHLTLYWQALEKMNRDYHVFTHLLNQESQICGQKDGPPLEGRLPTSMWKVGEIVADRYDIEIPPDVQPGQYQIEVGMYLLETGERLPALIEGNHLGGDRILLKPIQIRQE